MTEIYDFKKIEPKWQAKWEEASIFQAHDFTDKPKKYVLVEFPYPSGDGLHVGHCRSYTALDIVARKARMSGFNVMYPMGWDAFGLPTENYAIKTGVHPAVATRKNTDNFRRQMKSLGFSFDWSREINTTDPQYYKWTQWIFLKLLAAGLAYKEKMPINWCPSCKIGLANEEVVNGACERCGAEVEQREIEQWMLKITAYADKLLEGLEQVDFLDRVKEQQRNWIGRSEGAEIDFVVGSEKVSVYTTRIDTIFGVTALVLAPEHALVKQWLDKIENRKEVEEYINQTRKKSEFERKETIQEKTGVELKGIRAINPFTQDEVPVWIGDYVIASYGSGAVMMVPAHDERDFAFARQYNVPIKMVVKSEKHLDNEVMDAAFTADGVLVNSGEFSGQKSQTARDNMINWVEQNGCGRKRIQYHLRDWVFSRQHYWGEPIPVVYCEQCGIVPVPAAELPVTLPEVERYEPTDTGESPLASIDDWVKTSCPKCGGEAKRETDTMPNWAGSSWYFLRYIDPKNDEMLADPQKLKYWLPVDVYNGGMEHTTLHLLYSRFWNQFLYDQGIVPVSEPYAKRTSHGMVLGEGGIKMSKSRGNVINPDDVVAEYGADTLRTYEMFMGPFDGANAWSTDGIAGASRWLRRVWDLITTSEIGTEMNESWQLRMHESIKRVTEAIDQFKFNTIVSALMEWLNALEKQEGQSRVELETYVILLAPLAPHIAEELWEFLGHKDLVATQAWPKYEEEILKSGLVTLAIQVNGKLRGKLELERGVKQADVVKAAQALPNVAKYLTGGKVKKEIFVPDRLINFVG